MEMLIGVSVQLFPRVCFYVGHRSRKIKHHREVDLHLASSVHLGLGIAEAWCEHVIENTLCSLLKRGIWISTNNARSRSTNCHPRWYRQAPLGSVQQI